MSDNILQTVQENLGYPALQKIDPNTQQMVINSSTPHEDRFSQAALPAVLTALHNYGQTNEAAEAILNNDPATGWSALIFSDNKKGVIDEIAAYAGCTKEKAVNGINAIAREAILVIRERVSADGSVTDVKNILSGSLNDILLYLPASMQIGKLLHDNSLDDATHKMEGPASSLIQAIGRVFSTPESEEK